MGMYTELILKTEVKPDIPDEAEQVLQLLFNDGPGPTTLPDHPFFKSERWQMIGACSSYYHIPWSTSRYAEGYIFSRSDLKNYDSEISKFLDWVRPYLDTLPGDCIGWSWYEEDLKPKLLHNE